MKTEAEFMAEFDIVHRQYMELRAAKGFPINKPEPGRALPSWVLRVGDRPKLTFVTPASRPVSRPAKSVVKPAVELAKPVEVAVNPVAGESWASRVRVVIADAKRQGQSPEWVVNHAITVLGMKKTSAINCVKHNWDRVK